MTILPAMMALVDFAPLRNKVFHKKELTAKGLHPLQR